MKQFFFTLVALGLTTQVWAATITVTVTAGVNTVAHRIEKQTDGGAFTPLITLQMPSLQHIDSTVSLNHTYCYRAVGISTLDESAPSIPCCSALLPAGSPVVSCTVNP
jgi:hypothetical protein